TYWPDGHVAPNIPFVNRLDAAAALWRAGKIKYVIASGNRTGAYDEPTAIRDGLVERGVPAEIIYRDFAGYRTLDSLLRARDIYGVKRLVIVSQKSHDERALFLGRALGIDAWGLAVREEEPDGPSLLERLTVAGQALLAWWDVAVATPARERGQKVAIGVDPVNSRSRASPTMSLSPGTGEITGLPAKWLSRLRQTMAVMRRGACSVPPPKCGVITRLSRPSSSVPV